MRKEITKKLLMKDTSDWSRDIYSYFVENEDESSKYFDIVKTYQKFKKMDYNYIALKNTIAMDHETSLKSNHNFWEVFKVKVDLEDWDETTFSLISFNMVCCPKGVFSRGGDLRVCEEYKKIERPFFIGETMVTHELYKVVMSDFLSTEPYYNRKKIKEYNPDTPKHPIVNLTWYDAIKFCNHLSKMHGLQEYYRIDDSRNDSYYKNNRPIDTLQVADVFAYSDANGYRLPNLDEFEYAAKAGTSNEWAGTNNGDEKDDFGWFKNDGKMHMVAMKKPNEWGIYDMNGNGEEFLQEVLTYDKDGKLLLQGTIDEETNTNIDEKPYYPYHVKYTNSWVTNTLYAKSTSISTQRGFRLARNVI